MEFRSCPKRFQNNYVPLYFFSGLEKRGLSTFFFRWIFVIAKLSHTEMRQHMTTPLCPILKTPEKNDTLMFMGGKEGNLAFDSFPNSKIFSCSCQQKLLGSLWLSPWVGVSFRGVQSGNGPRDWAWGDHRIHQPWLGSFYIIPELCRYNGIPNNKPRLGMVYGIGFTTQNIHTHRYTYSIYICNEESCFTTINI